MENSGKKKFTEDGVKMFDSLLHIVTILFIISMLICIIFDVPIGVLIFAGLGILMVRQHYGWNLSKKYARELNMSHVDYLNDYYGR